MFWRLDKIADVVNPLLTLWAVLVLLRHSRHSAGSAAPGANARASRFWRVAGAWLLCIAVVYVVAHLNRWLHLWPGHKYFPSGHASYFACVATLGATLERRSLALTMPLLALYSLLMVQMNYHSWPDIAGAVALAPALTLAILRWLGQSARLAEARTAGAQAD